MNYSQIPKDTPALSQDPLLQESLLTVQTQGFVSIKHILRDSFQIEVQGIAEEEKDGSSSDQVMEEDKPQQVQTMLHNLLSGFQPKQFKPKKPSVANEKLTKHLKLLSTLLYGAVDYKNQVRHLSQSFQSMGVCAKPMKAGDVAWKCEDCEKDSTCIICQDCFNKSDHTGHRVWLKTNVGGCCDCGDPDAWDEKGFCCDHKGFAASTESMLAALPLYIKEAAPYCFNSLANQLKSILLKFQKTPSQDLKDQTQQIIKYLSQAVADLNPNIYFVSKSLPLIFLGEHTKPEGHICNHRYFINEDEEHAFSTQFAEFDETKNLCTCSALDLLFQTSILLDKATGKVLYQLLFTLFQTYEFKQALAMTYIANLDKLTLGSGDEKSLISIGVQLLTIDSITLQIMRDKGLRDQIVETNINAWRKLIEEPKDSTARWNVYMMAADLKYMAKPATLPAIIQETDFVERMIQNMSNFHFNDCSKCPSQMQPFDESTTDIMARADMESKVVNYLQKYLNYVQRPEDIQRILNCFEQTLVALNAERVMMHKNQGFVGMPVVRLLAYFLTRLKLTQLVEHKSFHLSDALVNAALELLAVQNGFLAEVKARVWIYKGDTFQNLPSFQNEQFMQCFLPDLGLLQTLISFKPSCIDRFVHSFGTDQPSAPLQILYRKVWEGNENLQEIVESLGTDVQPEKLGLLIQGLLTKLTQTAVHESSLVYSSKHLFEGNEHSSAQLDLIFKSLIQRELVHNLFMQGASSSVEKIKKGSDKFFTSKETFMQTLVQVSTAQQDNNGKKTFRLKDQYLSMYDPYYYVTEKHFTLQNAAYGHHRQNPVLNNIVGDFKSKYVYASSLNKEVWTALATQNKFRNFVVLIVSEFLKKSSLVESKLISLQSFNAALKLLIIVCQNLDLSDQAEEFKEFARRLLPLDLLKSSDEKLQEILHYLSSLVHSTGGDSPMQDHQQTKAEKPQAATNSKEAMLKKKQAMIAKMKLKQQSFIEANQPIKTTVAEDPQPSAFEETKDQQEAPLSCAACQELLNASKFNSRSFIQLGYITRTKLLYHSYLQTHKQRKNAFENLAMTHGAKIQHQPDNIDKISNLQELQKTEERNLVEFGLDGVVDDETKCGIQFNRCCHYFHTDCLEEYITADKKKSYQESYMQTMLGLDDNMIQCPLCKGISNAYQPLQPVTQETKTLTSHIDFLSMICNAPKRDPKLILQVDIANNPESFLQSIQEFVTLQMLTLTSYRQSELFKLYDAQSPSNSFSLRDLVFVMKSAFEITRRSQDDFTLKELSDILVVSISTNNYTENPFLRNHAKLAVQMLFCMALGNADDILLQTTLDALYTVFKAQVAAANLFEQQYKPFDVTEVNNTWPTKMRATELSDNVVHMQLQFLRATSCMKIVLKALRTNEVGNQLGVDIAFMDQMKTQVDDQAEFKLLTDFLNLDTRFASIYQMPVPLTEDDAYASSDPSWENLKYGIVGATSLTSELEAQLTLLIQNKHGQQPEIPAAMNLLVPSGTFQLFQLPPDFQTLVRDYYQKQCRNCQKQLQNNAICLICGEILCFFPKDNCCHGLLGMRESKGLHAAMGKDQHKNLEAELSYHARYWEGNCAVFLLPSTSQVMMIDEGRIAEYDSFYRNDVGASFNAKDSQKWENFFCSDETGGAKILQTLKKLLIQGEIPNRIMQERTRKGSVIRRNVY